MFFTLVSTPVTSPSCHALRHLVCCCAARSQLFWPRLHRGISIAPLSSGTVPVETPIKTFVTPTTHRGSLDYRISRVASYGLSPPLAIVLKPIWGFRLPAQSVRSPQIDFLLFSGKCYLHCTEPWFGRRVVLVAYTVMGSISIPPELEEKLQALGIPTPDSLSTEYYFHNPVGPGQPEQTRLPFLPEKKNKVWKAGQLNHEWVGCVNVDSLESENT